MKENYNSEKIRELMAERGVTIAELKRAIDIKDHNTAAKFVNGSSGIRVSRLLQIAQFFGVSVADFFVSEGGTKEDALQAKSLVSREKEKPVTFLPTPKPRVDEEVGTKIVLEAERKIHEIEMSHLHETSDLKLEYERKIAELQRENAVLRTRLEKNATDSDSSSAHAMIAYRVDKEEYITRAAEALGGVE